MILSLVAAAATASKWLTVAKVAKIASTAYAITNAYERYNERDKD